MGAGGGTTLTSSVMTLAIILRSLTEFDASDSRDFMFWKRFCPCMSRKFLMSDVVRKEVENNKKEIQVSTHEWK